ASSSTAITTCHDNCGSSTPTATRSPGTSPRSRPASPWNAASSTPPGRRPAGRSSPSARPSPGSSAPTRSDRPRQAIGTGVSPVPFHFTLIFSPTPEIPPRKRDSGYGAGLEPLTPIYSQGAPSHQGCTGLLAEELSMRKFLLMAVLAGLMAVPV